MARTVKDEKLESRAAREKLAPRGKPYYRAIEAGLHLGYRKAKGRPGQRVAGTWVLRRYAGAQTYVVERIGAADDFMDADGAAVLSFKHAQHEARRRHTQLAKATRPGPLTVRTAVEEYLAFLEANRKSSGDARYKAEAFILPPLGDKDLVALTTKELRHWLNGLAKAPRRLRTGKGKPQQFAEVDNSADGKRRRQSTANRILTILKAALNQQFKDGNVTSDVEWRRVTPFRGADEARVRYLSIDECQRLMNAASPDFRQLVTGAITTGARYGELCALEVRDYNPDSETLHVRTSKGGKGRHIELTTEGISFIERHCRGMAGDELMFKHTSGEPWGTAHQARPMLEACKAAQIKPAISIHGLRHTWASHAVMNGVPLIVVAKNLGHRDTRMVEKFYGHLAPSYVREAIREKAPTFGIATSGHVLAATSRTVREEAEAEAA